MAEWTGEECGPWTLKGVKSVKVDGKRVKADTWYKLAGGKLREVVE